MLKRRFLKVLHKVKNRWKHTAYNFSYTIGLDCITLEANSTAARQTIVGC